MADEESRPQAAASMQRYCAEHRRRCDRCPDCKKLSFCPDCNKCHEPGCSRGR